MTVNDESTEIMLKNKRNINYLEMLDKSISEAKKGNVIIKNYDELDIELRKFDNEV